MNVTSLIQPQYLQYLLAVGGCCSVIAAVLKPPVAGATGWYPAVYTIVNFLAVNFGHARNASSPTITTKE
jgi:hypothetical protein